MRVTDFGLYWQRIRDRFPEVQERDRLVPIVELKEQSVPNVGWKLSSVVELPRTWYVGEMESGDRHFIQMQPDRFLYNWKSGNPPNYPSYESNRDSFVEHLKGFQEYIVEANLNKLEVDQCELTYVNHIFLDAGVDLSEMASKAFSVFAHDSTLPGHRDRFSFIVSSWIDDIAGRLHATIQPAQNMETRELVIDFRLTARGAPKEAQSSKEWVAWFDKAHNEILGAFKSLTTSEMHSRWGIFEA